MLAYCIRVTMPELGVENSYYFVPGQNPFFPKIIDETKGLPAYGQVFLAETIGGCLMILCVLNLKYQVKMGADLYYYPIGYTVCSIALNQMFKRLSGGVFNPALALAQICWQNLTYYYEIGSDSPYWTPDYAVCYILGPMFGAFLGGNLFNF